MLHPELERKVERFSQKFELLTHFERLFRLDDFDIKHMFGGMALYGHGKMLFCIMEDSELNSYKDKKFPYPIWNGVLIPTHREYHDQFLKISKDFTPHAVLGKWMYIPQTIENFEELTSKLTLLALKNSDMIGIFPKPKKKPVKKKKAVKKQPLKKSKTKVKKKTTRK